MLASRFYFLAFDSSLSAICFLYAGDFDCEIDEVSIKATAD